MANNYNPDVLNCIANLSNDEVFTPPALANQVLDMLPQELFNNPGTTFLDPFTKSGVFLREIVKRLDRGLESAIPDRQERIDHIMHRQVFGIACTELTAYLSRRSLYCTKHPDGEYSVSRFANPEGNIQYKALRHTWEGGKCRFCGASKEVYDRGDAAEQYAYQFIHTDNPESIFNMKFDVIIGNPPYQLNDGGSGSGMSAKPIYQLFIAQAKKLSPRYLSMIIPSRWFSGGKGLDGFRAEMLSDRHIRKLVDYENFRDVFPNVDLAGGACYFLWDSNYDGACEVSNFINGELYTSTRDLNQYDFFIRSNKAISIVDKINRKHKGSFLNERVSTRLPFGIPTTYLPVDKGIPCYFTQRIGIKYVKSADVVDSLNILNKWKLLVPKAPIAGQTDFSRSVGFYYEGNTRIAKPGECCSESWLVAGSFESKQEVESFKSYLFTKIVRFLLLQTVVSQNITRKNYCFVPDIGKYSTKYDDDFLRELWGISQEQWEYIDSKITSVEDIGQ